MTHFPRNTKKQESLNFPVNKSNSKEILLNQQLITLNVLL